MCLNDYPTPDGTGVRDSIHVVDLAKVTLRLYKKKISSGSGLNIYNLGTGRGYSVIWEIIQKYGEGCRKTNSIQDYWSTTRRYRKPVMQIHPRHEKN